MDDAARRAIAFDASQLTARFYSHVDGGRLKEAGNLFLDDGVWHRVEGKCTGPDQVTKALEARDPSRVSAHIINNLIVDVKDPVSVEVTATIVAYHATPAAKGPATDAKPAGMFRCIELWKKTAQGWKIADKQNIGLMRFGH
jgi:hypothetical protein